MNAKVYQLIGTALAIGAAAVARKVTEGGWKAVMATEPPAKDPEANGWEVVLWAAISGAAIATARTLVTRKVNAYAEKSMPEKQIEVS